MISKAKAIIPQRERNQILCMAAVHKEEAIGSRKAIGSREIIRKTDLKSRKMLQ